MATLIAVYNSEGCVGRCDANCYEAHDDRCECICGGMNHGAGRDRAVDNTTAMADDWIERYADARGLQAYRARVPARDPQQWGLLESTVHHPPPQVAAAHPRPSL
jgi:hypothetical protein